MNQVTQPSTQEPVGPVSAPSSPAYCPTSPLLGDDDNDSSDEESDCGLLPTYSRHELAMGEIEKALSDSMEAVRNLVRAEAAEAVCTMRNDHYHIKQLKDCTEYLREKKEEHEKELAQLKNELAMANEALVKKTEKIKEMESELKKKRAELKKKRANNAEFKENAEKFQQTWEAQEREYKKQISCLKDELCQQNPPDATWSGVMSDLLRILPYGPGKRKATTDGNEGKSKRSRS